MTPITLEYITNSGEIKRVDTQGSTQIDLPDFYRAIKTYPALEGFEQVIGRKFTCEDCDYYRENSIIEHPYRFQGELNFYRGCEGHHKGKNAECFDLCEKIKAEIKLMDKEIEDTKIDTHPRYLIRNEVMYYIKEDPVAFLIDFNPKKQSSIRLARFKLELIL